MILRMPYGLEVLNSYRLFSICGETSLKCTRAWQMSENIIIAHLRFGESIMKASG